VTRRERIVTAVLLAAVALAAVPELVQLAWHARVFAGRLAFPLDLEWMEGGMLVHAQRIAAGDGIYVKPSLDFVPFLYTPLYPALLALLSFVLPLGYVLGRAVSLVALTSALVLLVACAGGEARGQPLSRRALAALVGVGGAAAVVAAFHFTAGFYDLVRADSLLLALEALALWLALRGAGWRSAALAGLAIALGFFAKQTASIMGVGIGIGLLVANWRRGLVYGGAAALTLAAGLGLLVKTSGGWFWTYIFKLHQSHVFRRDAAFDVAVPETLKHAWPIFAALLLATVALALLRRLRRGDAILWSAALAGEAAAIVGFGTQWAVPNAYIPAVFFPALAAAVLAARLLLVALDSRRVLAGAAAALAVVGLGWQSQHVERPALAAVVPSQADRAAAARLIEQLRALPGELFIPFHTWYGVLAGKRPYVHRMGVRDVEAALGRPAGLDQALADQRFSAIVLDWKALPGEFPYLHRYHLVHELREGVDSVRMFAGAETSPRQLLLASRPAPPVPPGGRRLADFESGDWQLFAPSGEAFGPRPAPAPAGAYGRFAASSTDRGGVEPTGALRSRPLVIDRPRLRFLLAGPAAARLRVALLDGTEVVRSASPTGAPATVEWEVGELRGREVVLLIEDASPEAGLTVDEMVAY
jgi:hypothetical protein